MPDVDSYVEAYKAHLNTLFAAAANSEKTMLYYYRVLCSIG